MVTTPDTTKIIIPTLEVRRLRVRVEGITPLITHRPSEDSLKQIEDQQQGAAKVKKAPRHPKAEFEAASYRTRDGAYGFPAIGIKKAMVSAGQRFADLVGTELYGAITIPVEVLELRADAPRMRTDRVVLGGRTTTIAYRPEFMPWAIDVPITFIPSFISAAQIVNLLRLAGFSVGIGDWRIEKKGTFGQFQVTEVEAE